MAFYYVDGTSGDDANDGLTPATAWQTFDKPVTTAGFSSSSIDTVILLSDTTFDLSTSTSGTLRKYMHITSDSEVIRKINMSSVGSSSAIYELYGAKHKIEFDRNVGDSNGADIRFYGNNTDCIFRNNSSTTSSIFFINGNFVDCLFTSSNSGSYRFDDVELYSSYIRCNFDVARFNTSSGLTNDRAALVFDRCIFNLCSNETLPSSVIYVSREISLSFTNCSVKLNSGQNFVYPGITSSVSTTHGFVYIDNCIFEGQSGENYALDLRGDMADYINIQNSILFDCLTHNPIYSINSINLTTTLSTNYVSTDYSTPSTYFTLTNDSVARQYTSPVDAGAVQNEPVVLYPEVGEVKALVPFGTGASGDRVGTRTDADPADVLVGEQYGADGTEFTGTYIPSPPPNNYDLRKDVVVGAVTGILEVPDISQVEDGLEFDRTDNPLTGTMTPVTPQQGPFSVTVYTSDGSNISIDTPQSNITVEVESGVLINTILSDLGAIETVADIDTIRNINFPNRLDIRINK